MKTYVIYNASAGSGKTFTLILEYLKLVLQNCDNENVKKILAITFTNKSSNDIKLRILQSLEQLANKKSSKYEDKLQSELNFSLEKICKNAKKVFTYILHNYSFFSISTIDKFNTKLIRSFSKELGIPQQFSIEHNYNYFIEKAVEELINQIGMNNPYANLIIDFFFKQYEEGDYNDKNIKSNLTFQLQNSIDEKNFFFVNSLQDKTIEDVKKLEFTINYRKKVLPKQMLKITNKILNLLESNQICHEDFIGKSNSIKGFFEKVESCLIRKDYKKLIEQLNFKIIHNIRNNTLIHKDSKNHKQLELILPEIIENFREYHFFLENYIIASKISKQLLDLQVSCELQRLLEKIKSEQGIIFLCDINPMIYKNLKKESGAHIYERIGSRYEHYFFDEFQDTSQLQWDFFSPLVDDIIAQQNHSVTIFADVKQSIYRFRGAKPELLINEIQKINNKLNERGIIKNLSNNYRSKTNIVAFNNKIYNTISNLILGEEYHEIYQNCHQNSKGKIGGRVQVAYFDFENYEKFTHTHILKIIVEHQKKGKNLNEIVVLFKNVKPMKRLENFLLSHHIPIITDNILLVNEISSIAILFSLLRWIENPQDKNLLFELLIGLENEKKPSIKEEFSKFVTRIKSYNSIEIIKKINKRYEIKLEFLTKDYCNTFDLFEDLIRSMNFNLNCQLYFSSILDEIYKLESSRSISISKFLTYVEKHKDKIKYQLPKKNNSVQLMTIHKSKGLEFPVVIYPNFNTRKNPQDGMYWFELNEEDYAGFKYFYFKFNDKEKLKINSLNSQIHCSEVEQNIDELNLHYVATTRSSSELFLIFPKRKIVDKKITKIICELPFGRHIKKTFKLDLKEEFFELFKLKQSSQEKSKITIKNYDVLPLFEWVSNSWNTKIHFCNKNEELLASIHSQEYENLIHYILIKIQTKFDIQAIYNQAINQGVVPLEWRKNLLDIVKKVIFHEKLEIYFDVSNQIYNQREILLESLIYRPDKIIERNGKFIIIDYKSGKFNDQYLLQLKQYENILLQSNYQVEKKLLVMINSKVKVIDV